MRLSILCFCLFCLAQSCDDITQKRPDRVYDYHDVGDILFDETIDRDDFVLCDSTDIDHRRNSLVYPGGKKHMMTLCRDGYKASEDFTDFTGYVVVRFLINCEGKTGRFRSEVLDLDFTPAGCSASLKNHILSIVKGLDQWADAKNSTPNRDHSKYINFKIVKGELESVHL